MLFFYFVVGVQHPEIVGFDIAPDPPVANDPVAKIRIQGKVVIVAFLKVHSLGGKEISQQKIQASFSKGWTK